MAKILRQITVNTSQTCFWCLPNTPFPLPRLTPQPVSARLGTTVPILKLRTLPRREIAQLAREHVMITKPRQKAKNILPVAQDIWGLPLKNQDREMQGLCPGHPCFCNLLGSCGKGSSHQSYKGCWLLSTLSQTERRLKTPTS